MRRTHLGLLSSRRNAECLFRHNDGWLECSDPDLLSMIRVTNEAAAPLRDSLVPIDEILVAFLDPEGRSFPRRELVAEHGFPDVDLRELDLEWA
jgi:hypothetical protein